MQNDNLYHPKSDPASKNLIPTKRNTALTRCLIFTSTVDLREPM